MSYSNDFKLKICKLVCDEGMTVTQVSNDYKVARKSVDLWLHKFRKDPSAFHRDQTDEEWFKRQHGISEDNYINMTERELRKELMNKDIEIARLKKGYTVKGVGAKKEYVTFFKKNTK